MTNERRQPSSSRSRLALPLAFALIAPFAAVPLLCRTLAERWGHQAGSALARQATLMWPPPGPEAQTPYQGLGIGDGIRLSLPYPDALLPPTPPAARSRLAAPGRQSAPHRGILVRADTVARAVASGARPAGDAVAASGPRPAGIVLHGVSGFQAGLRDGDVLTSVGGTAATSGSVVVAAVSGALRSGANAIGAVVWRGDQPIAVTVEIPERLRRSWTRERRPGRPP
jgi:hypothetical protein